MPGPVAHVMIDLDCDAGRRLTNDDLAAWREPCPEIPSAQLVIGGEPDNPSQYMILNLCPQHDRLIGEVLGQ